MRLAARALVEWRTPKTSPEYREILRALAAERGLTGLLDETSGLVGLDDSGVLLWCLSERGDQLDGATPGVRLTRDDVRRKIQQVLGDTITHAKRAETADAVARLLTKRSSRGQAIQALAAMMSGQPADESNALAELTEMTGRHRLSVFGLANRIRILAMTVRGATLLAGAAAAAALPVALAGVGSMTSGSEGATGALFESLAVAGIAVALLQRECARIAVDREIRRTISAIVKNTSMSPDALASEFCTNVALWGPVMRSESSRWWVSLVFGWANAASLDVQRHVLSLLRDPDIPQDVRDVMLSWLLRLNARPADVLVAQWRRLRAV